jgi:2-isopropylmalate synthase
MMSDNVPREQRTTNPEPSKKYRPFRPIALPDRQWPGRTLTAPPLWCSIDLRDGNQSLPIPMSVDEKIEMFELLYSIGFKEIEVGFPAASPTEHAFLRRLIENDLIPPDVTIQVLVQSREDLIRQTFESLRGVKRAIIHLYNSTSSLQRRVVFKATQEDILNIALSGARFIRQHHSLAGNGAHIRYQYSPESFTGTELDFALTICEAVLDEWQASPEDPVIINLPSTVELASPNIYADQIEWFSRHLRERSRVILSLHPHNDRGTAVAAAELAMLAGADRLEGSLFGNGERTGNVDIITLALNMLTQGLDPLLDFSDITRIKDIYERCTRMTVHERQPYAGELVYTAFSGSHQDAISKGLAALAETQSACWEVPYLPIDPGDVGRRYEPIIRSNSQSGKGGVAFIMETSFGYKLPKPMHAEFSRIVTKTSDAAGIEMTPDTLLSLFKNEYVDLPNPYKLGKYRLQEMETAGEDETLVDFCGTIFVQGEEREVCGRGNGPLDAFFQALAASVGLTGYKFLSYDQHALGSGSDSRAIAYIRLEDERGQKCFGVGTSKNISKASMRALLSAINRLSG